MKNVELSGCVVAPPTPEITTKGPVGACVGLEVGIDVGLEVVGLSVGCCVGDSVVGCGVGDSVVGCAVGDSVVGADVGDAVVGANVGDVGDNVGTPVGLSVGSKQQHSLNTPTHGSVRAAANEFCHTKVSAVSK